uniref:S41 family peptidase n=1 Tax=Ningiella ruwaisensis TaxID=2364274 RepID=UPI0010A09C46|nr:S41 family peptidase [Ningiella ruwaisensis]
MKRIICIASLALFSASTLAEITPEWVRYPAISPDGQHIAFTYKGDIYSVPSTGGQATRLTFHKAHDYNPVWSHDSQQLAFASDRFGNFDVYTMSAAGGEATRLTFHSANEEPYTFTRDNAAIIFGGQRMDTSENREYPSSRMGELYSVPSSGGRITQVFSLPAEDAQFSPNGETLIYHDYKGTENKWRKHHKSAITRDIWTFDIDSKEHRQITEFEGEDRNPVFADENDAVFYLSEKNGSFNVYRMDLDRPSRSTQLTDFNTHPVRFLSYGNGTLAFSYHGELYTLDASSGKTQAQKVKISIRTQDVDNKQERVSVNGEIADMAISPDGKEIAFIAKGDVFVSSVDGAFTKQITDTPSQENFVSFSDEGDAVLYASERDSKWSIFKSTKVREQEPFFYAATLIKESSLIENEKDNYLPKVSPDGKKLAYVEDRRTLKVMDLATGKSVTLLKPDIAIHFGDGDMNFSWSPDSEWILFEHKKQLHNYDIAMIKASGDEAMQVLVPSGYFDYSPKWVNDGKQIIWMSDRDGLRSYATSGRTENDVYSLFFTQDAWDEFRLSEDDYKLMQAIEEAQKDEEKEADKETDAKSDDETDDDDSKEEVEPLEIELEGLNERIARLTLHSSRLADAVLSKDAQTLYYLTQFEDKLDLWETNLRTKETKKAIGLGVSRASLSWDPNMENLYLLADGNISKLDLEKGSQEQISVNAQVVIKEEEARKQAFEHVWLRTAKIFYEPTYHGVDWKKMGEAYAPKVAHVGNEYEFTELLSELLGELNVSHSGAGYRPRLPDADNTASLGIFFDYSHDDAGIKITEVISGGPLDKAAFDVKPGMLITHIDGEKVEANMDWAKLLNLKSDKFVLLDLIDTAGQSQQITVKPISQGEEQALLYKRFIKINEQEVLKRSNGQLGYVHIPGMSDGPYRDVYDEMMGRFSDKKAMVVDTRYNGGGDLVADLAMFFTGEAFLTYATEQRVVGGEPTSRYTKPVVTLFNEAMYSDGHCYASGFQDLDLGVSVGMPVPGTCSFAGWEGLPTGGYWGVVPVSAKNKAGEWLENNETAPDVKVKNMPGIIDAGRDQQLERAIKEALDEI